MLYMMDNSKTVPYFIYRFQVKKGCPESFLRSGHPKNTQQHENNNKISQHGFQGVP